MSTEFSRASQEEKLIEGTIKILKDLIYKLDYFCDCIKTAPIDENDVINTIALYKDHLQRSHDVVNNKITKQKSHKHKTIDVITIVIVVLQFCTCTTLKVKNCNHHKMCLFTIFETNDII